MRDAYFELIVGLLTAIVLVYLLIVVNFQSWLDPLIIITALPGALAGIAWSLFVTHTRLSEPALTGAIMTMGMATANSILVVSYARERLQEHGDALQAAIEAGRTRFRPVLMTASAMIIGMVPMAIGYSQNAPLGRAVIGGLHFVGEFRRDTFEGVPALGVTNLNDQKSGQYYFALEGGMTPVCSLRTTFSHISDCAPGFDKSAWAKLRPPVFSRSLWQPAQ